MPTVFRVLESAGRSESYFAYTGAEDQIGEPSVYGTVYRSYRSSGSGENLASGDRWIVKESKSVDYRKDFKFEYDVLRNLARASEQLNGGAFSPFPVYLLERVDTGMPALAMPFYGEEVEREIYHWSQTKLLEVMGDYVRLLIALKRVGPGYTCTDRKQDDLRWDQGHLVVIDWNLLRDATPEFIQTEISIFGRLWYSMLTGRVPTSTLNAFDDAHWQPVTATDSILIRDLLLGTRLIITRAAQSFYTSLDALQAAIKTWLDTVNMPPQTAGTLQMSLQVSAAKAEALLVDLNPHRLRPDDFQAERRAALASAASDEDPLSDIQAALNYVGEHFSRGDFQSALAALGTISFNNTVQRAAGERWRLLLSAAGNADPGERQDARQLTDNWRRALDTLLNRPWNERSDAASEPLVRAETTYRDSANRFRGTLRTALLTLADEAKLRIEMLRVEQAMQRGESAVEALQAVDNLRRVIPYADLVMEGFDLAAASQHTATSAQLNTQVGEARAAMLNWLQAWDTADAVSSYDALERIKGVEQASGKISGAAGSDVASRVLVYRQIVQALPGLREQPPIELVQFGSGMRSRLDGEVAAALDTQITRLIREQSRKVADRAEQAVRGVERPTSENAITPADVEKIYRQASDFLATEIAGRLADDVRSKLNTNLHYLKPQYEFFRSLTSLTTPDTFDVLEQAERARVSIYHPDVWAYTQRALDASKNRQSSLTREYMQKADDLHGEVMRLQSDYTNKLDEQKRELDTRIQRVKAETEQNTSSLGTLGPRIGELEQRVGSTETVAKQSAPRRLAYIIGGAAVLALIAGIGGILLSVSNGETGEQVQALGQGATEIAITLAANDPRQSALEGDVERLAAQQVALEETMSAAVMTINAPTPTPLPSPTELPAEATAEATDDSGAPTGQESEATEEPAQAAAQPVTAKRFGVMPSDRTAFQRFSNDTLITIPFDQLGLVELGIDSPFHDPYEAIKKALSGSEGTLFLATVDGGDNVIPVLKTGNLPIFGYESTTLPASSYSFLRSDNTLASYTPDVDLTQSVNLPLEVTLLPVDDGLRTAITQSLDVRAGYLSSIPSAPINGDYALALVGGNRLVEILWGQQLISFARWIVSPREQTGFRIRADASVNDAEIGAIAKDEVALVALVDSTSLTMLDQPTNTQIDLLLSRNAIVRLDNESAEWWYLEATIGGAPTFGWARRGTFNLTLALDMITDFPLNSRITLRPLQS